MKTFRIKNKIVIGIIFLIFLLCVQVAYIPFKSIFSYQHDNLKRNNSEIIIDTPENKTYTKPMSGYYPGTFGFENDIEGDSPKGWYDPKEAGCSSTIVNEFNGHKKVLKLEDQSTANSARLYGNISAGTHNLELWYYPDTTCFSTIELSSSDHRFFYMQFDHRDNSVRYYDGEYHWFYWGYVEKWYHLRFEMDYDNDQYDIYFDGEKVLENAPFENSVDVFFAIKFRSWDDTEGVIYIDAIGLSEYPSYNEGDNLHEGLLLSFDNTTSIEWTGYSLDGNTNTTIYGNTTISIPDAGIHVLQIFANNSFGTLFKSEKRYFTIEYLPLYILTPESRTYTYPMEGYYPASIGFDSDISGAIPSGWTDESGFGCFPSVIDNLTNHRKLLELFINADGDTKIYKTFQSHTQGIVEWWWRTTDSEKSNWVYFRDEDINGPNIFIDEGKFGYYDGTFHQLNFAESDRWYHSRIIFDCSNNKFDWFIDGHKIVDQGNFREPVEDINKISLQTWDEALGVGWYVYYDAFGFSWDPNYKIGDNLKEGLLLSFNNESLDWMAYSLNDQTKKYISGNTTICLPTNHGSNHIQVFGQDSSGNLYSSVIKYFNIDYPEISVSNIQVFYEYLPIGFNQIITCEISARNEFINATAYIKNGTGTTVAVLNLINTEKEIFKTTWDSTGEQEGYYYVDISASYLGDIGNPFYEEYCAVFAVVNKYDVDSVSWSNEMPFNFQDQLKYDDDINYTPDHTLENRWDLGKTIDGFSYEYWLDEYTQDFSYSSTGDSFKGTREANDGQTFYQELIVSALYGSNCTLYSTFTFDLGSEWKNLYMLQYIRLSYRIHWSNGDDSPPGSPWTCHLPWSKLEIYNIMQQTWELMDEDLLVLEGWTDDSISFENVGGGTQFNDRYISNDGQIKFRFSEYTYEHTFLTEWGISELYLTRDYISLTIGYNERAIGFNFNNEVLNGENDYFLWFQGKTSDGVAQFRVNGEPEFSFGEGELTIGCSSFFDLYLEDVSSIEIYYETAESLVLDYLFLIKALDPMITSPADISYYEGETGNVISWGICYMEPSVWFYNVTKDGTEFSTGIMDSRVPIDLNVDGLGAGEYHFLITARNGWGDYLEDELVVTVIPVINLLFVDLISHSFSTEEFKVTLFISDEFGIGVGSATIQAFWNGTDVSTNVQNLGDGLYSILLTPITVAPGEDPILLSMIISADGYEEKSFETYIAVDPDILEKEVGKPAEEFPISLIIIAIISTVGGIGVAGISIFLLRRKKRTSIGI